MQKEELLKKIYHDKRNLKSKIKELIDDSKVNTLKYFAGSAIITFNTKKEKEIWLKQIPKSFVEYCINLIINLFNIVFFCCKHRREKHINFLKRNIKYEAAPEPEDIIFENMETKKIIRVIRTILFFLISIFICFISFIIVASLNKLQEYLDEKYEGHTFILYFISVLISIVLDLIDFALEQILETLTKKERQITKTNFYLSYSIKLTISSSLNSVLVPFLSEIVFTKSKDMKF